MIAFVMPQRFRTKFKSCMYVYCIILMYTSEYVRVDFPSEVEVVGVQSVAAARRR